MSRPAKALNSGTLRRVIAQPLAKRTQIPHPGRKLTVSRNG
jgi:hypothetical protein